MISINHYKQTFHYIKLVWVENERSLSFNFKHNKALLSLLSLVKTR